MITQGGSEETSLDGCGACVSRRSLMAAALAAGGAAVAGAAAPAAAGQAQWINVATHGALEVGECRLVTKRDGSGWLLTRVRPGAYRAFSPYCTHQQALLSPRPTKIKCNRHGSEFSKRTGEVLRGPAPADLEEFPARIRRGRVQILA